MTMVIGGYTLQFSATRFPSRDRPSAQSFPENAGPYGSGFAATSVGFALHATYPVLAEAEGSIRSLAPWTPPQNSDSGLCFSPGPLDRQEEVKKGVTLHTVHRRKVVCRSAGSVHQPGLPGIRA